MTSPTQSSPQRLGRGTISLGVAVIVLLMAIPLILIQNSQFGGSDGAGSEIIERIAPEYDSSWTTNWWTPPGSETESMLFALQATAGGILIGYFFGYSRGRQKGRQENPTGPIHSDAPH